MRKPRQGEKLKQNQTGDKMKYKRAYKVLCANGITTIVHAFNKAEAMAFAQQFTDIKVVDAYVVNAEGQRVAPGGHFGRIAKKFGVKYHRGHLWSFDIEAIMEAIPYLQENGFHPRVIHKIDPVDKKPYVIAEVAYM